MTEAEWITTKLPLYMLREYPARWSERKARLFWCACLRRVWNLVTDERTRRLMRLMENLPDDAEGSLRPEIEAVRRHLTSDSQGAPRHPDWIPYHADYWKLGVFVQPPPDPLVALARGAVEHAIDDAVRRAPPDMGLAAGFQLREDTEAAEKVWQCALIREIFGNPFRPVDVSPWLTSDVLALARGIYDDNAFDRMPILADALQDAGCGDVNVLDHCRDATQLHVRGCWVVDSLLGKG
jgi:hypothetical protein